MPACPGGLGRAPGSARGSRAPFPSGSGLPPVTSSGDRPGWAANRRAGAQERPVDAQRRGTLGSSASGLRGAGRSPAPRWRVKCARSRAPSLAGIRPRATQRPPNLLEVESHGRPRTRPSSPPPPAPTAVEASGQGRGEGPERGRGLRGLSACDSPPPRRPRLSGAMAPPPSSPSMAPPRLIHSARGLPDTCSQLLPSSAVAEKMSDPGTDTPSAIQICRIMRPDDANVAGNVHGGTILKMIEEAGAIISTRHCNSQNGERCVAALARVERTDFLSPMCIGEVAHVSAELTYTSKHSVEVQVHVMSENILTGTKKMTNKATLWYVPLSLKNVDKVLEVPPIVYSRQELEEEGRKRYEAQKLERMETKWRNGDIVQPVLNPEPNTVSYSQSSLIHLVGPSDCTLHGFVHGGVTMKLMDEVAGIVAARHCKTNIVTASVDAINFHDKIRKGCVITISGRMTFTSNKSMEIEVLVDADPVVDNSQKRYRAASAFFTYVSLNQEGKPLPVPQLVPETEDEKKRFEEGKGRYLQMKAKRQGHTEPQP